MTKLRSAGTHSFTQCALITLLLCSPLLMNKAQAQDGWQFTPYVRIDGGISSTVDNNGTLADAAATHSIDVLPLTGHRLQAGLGAKLSEYLRVDVTVSYRDHLARADSVRLSSGTVFQTSLGRHNASNITTLFNVYVDPFAAIGMDTGAFSPYLQGGIGWARNTTASMKFSSVTIHGATHDDVAWQIGAGLNYALTDHWKIDSSYRFLDMGQARSSKNIINGVTPSTLNQETRFDLQAHEVMLGLQYQF